MAKRRIWTSEGHFQWDSNKGFCKNQKLLKEQVRVSKSKILKSQRNFLDFEYWKFSTETTIYKIFFSVLNYIFHEILLIIASRSRVLSYSTSSTKSLLRRILYVFLIFFLEKGRVGSCWTLPHNFNFFSLYNNAIKLHSKSTTKNTFLLTFLHLTSLKEKSFSLVEIGTKYYTYILKINPQYKIQHSRKKAKW